MDKWDEEKLRKVVLSKAGNPRTTTDIVCKYFIDAIESEKFGWFWECPNGDTLVPKYRIWLMYLCRAKLHVSPCTTSRFRAQVAKEGD
jgi:hypothetical protein